jgi:aspartate/tyrosine/aromatic aminotransferase
MIAGETQPLFANLPLLPADPILDLGRVFAIDNRAHKINLGIGVYLDEQGVTPIMAAVAEAEARVETDEDTKAYLPPRSVPGFADAIARLALGPDSDLHGSGRLGVLQTPGGCGALGVSGGLMRRSGIKTVVMGTPTWSNHRPVYTAAGLAVRMIPYLDRATGGVDFAGYRAAVEQLGPDDVLLLHGACHNPTGVDLSPEQIDIIADIAAARGFLPMIDTAYHGLAHGLDDDAYILRSFAARVPELLISYSCSKNFGLYRERTGALIAIGKSADRAAVLESHMLDLAREFYSMAPAHGALIVADILGSPELEANWRGELATMQRSIQARRNLLADALEKTGLGDSLSYVRDQNGMFSLLPLSPEQTQRMRDTHAVHMAASGRINVCGIRADNVDYLAGALASTMIEGREMLSA